MHGPVLPLPDGSVDLCVANYVLELVAAPGDHLVRSRACSPGRTVRGPDDDSASLHGSRVLDAAQAAHLALASRLRALGSEAHEPLANVVPGEHRAATARAGSAGRAAGRGSANDREGAELRTGASPALLTDALL